MKTEFEIRVLEIDADKMKKMLEELGAKFVGDFHQKRYVYDLKPATDNKWIRLRTNGKLTTLTYKNVEKNTIDGTKELEIVVDDFEKTNEFLEILGYVHRNYQENERVQYELNGVEVDIDSWPLIPTYMEIEGKNEFEVLEIKNLLNVDEKK